MSDKSKPKRAGFKVEGPFSAADLDAAFPQVPQNAHASVEKLIEARAGEGLSLVSFSVSSGHWHFVFKADA